MLVIKNIVENPEFVIERLSLRNIDARAIVNEIIDLDATRRKFQKETDDLKADLNTGSRLIGDYMKVGKSKEAEELRQNSLLLKSKIKESEDASDRIDQLLTDKVISLPNLPYTLVAPGKGADDNVEVRAGGVMPELNESALPHWDLAKKYDIIDFELGAKITGAGFPVYKNKGAKLQRALINFFLDEAEKAGYIEMQPPVLVNEASGYGTGQLPDKEAQMYVAGLDNLYLIPTAEVPITNLYRDVIVDVEDLPIKNVAYTPCFRREAGTYGKDVKGLNRLHQFDKVEIVQVAHPEKSYNTLEMMVLHVEGLVKKLGLPYRILRLCGGDMGFTSAMTYDFEVYSAAQQRWLEVSSVSNFETFQANRLKLRFKDKLDKKTQLAHTLNGSALALPRIMAALLENNQTPEGIVIPEVLHKYINFTLIN